MNNFTITDPQFREATEAIAAGDVPALQSLLAQYPRLVREPLDAPEEGYFRNPYLLWFIADNPIRVGKLPANIVEIAEVILQAIRRDAPGTMPQQMYVLGLVATGRIPRECGVQLPLIDLLVDAGATPGKGIGALAHGNKEAARRLIERGGTLTLPTAVGLEWAEEVQRLLPQATAEEKQTALMIAAFYGNVPMLQLLIPYGVDVNAFLTQQSGFHSHATALHQAVSSGSLEAVKMLIKAGADPTLPDKIYNGTPLGWAMHMQEDAGLDETTRQRFAAIEQYLREKNNIPE